MELGLFSVSLTVLDLETSRDFYAKLGFEPTGGGLEQHYLIMRNSTTLIGLFQGMFDKNILTFNPGLDLDGGTAESFTDVREIQRELRARGLDLATEAHEGSSGPAHIVLEDPDGNPILIDQFS
jgi:catechol 2,3-dioxygenase-like lactoylglutathione lyase family enzyme